MQKKVKPKRLKNENLELILASEKFIKYFLRTLELYENKDSE